jgi:hypothetical protein
LYFFNIIFLYNYNTINKTKKKKKKSEPKGTPWQKSTQRLI